MVVIGAGASELGLGPVVDVGGSVILMLGLGPVVGATATGSATVAERSVIVQSKRSFTLLHKCAKCEKECEKAVLQVAK